MRRIPPHLIAGLVREALDEDIGPGDITTDSCVPDGLRSRATIEARQDLAVAGIAAAIECFRQLDPGLRVLHAASDGDALSRGGRLLVVTGMARALLSAERTALNFLAHLSGVATLTRRCVEAVGSHHAVVADTRKTTPALRLLEKQAVLAGGGTNHRAGLWDAVLIKDNHIDLAGGVRAAVERVREATRGEIPIETEVRSLGELDEALAARADAVLLDNFAPDDMKSAVERARGRALVEVSGGVRLETIPGIAALGVDRISIGALT
ncbi:MAG TPA: carboxylating nicotinate-nucleotide diphosphorylase, partial [Candidatus Saccharimonadales bacterium]|nr:carboxylating nicotinate-nucleotide diphosphorylase [Candidatus Saccharimonadales bacterium]